MVSISTSFLLAYFSRYLYEKHFVKLKKFLPGTSVA
jgi:hypothetical protein